MEVLHIFVLTLEVSPEARSKKCGCVAALVGPYVWSVQSINHSSLLSGVGVGGFVVVAVRIGDYLSWHVQSTEQGTMHVVEILYKSRRMHLSGY